MVYRSPLKLLALAGASSALFSADAIQNAKKKILEEMGDANQTVVDQIVYSKDQIIEVLDQLNEYNWQHHHLIYSYEGLLKFLETNEFDDTLIKKAASFSYKPSFVHFISGWFSFSFNSAASKFLQQADFKTLNLLVDHKGFMLPTHFEQAYESIREDLVQIESGLSDLSRDTSDMERNISDLIFSQDWIRFINKLPPFLEGRREDIVRLLLSVIAGLAQKTSWEKLHQMCLQLYNIECSVQCKEEIDKQEAYIRGNLVLEQLERNNLKRQRVLRISGATLLGLMVFIAFYFFRSDGKEKDLFERPAHHLIENASLEQQINTSGNERDFKIFLSAISMIGDQEGKLVSKQSNSAPFENVSILPEDVGTTPLTIKNKTKSDVVVFYFVNKNILVNGSSRVYSVYIKAGESFRMHIEPNFGRLNMVFGKRWVHLPKPYIFELRDRHSNLDDPDFGKSVGRWEIKEYFEVAAPFLFYLNHDISITNFKPDFYTNTSAPVPTLIYAPDDPPNPYSSESAGEVELILRQEDGIVKLVGDGSSFIIEGTETFDLTEALKGR